MSYKAATMSRQVTRRTALKRLMGFSGGLAFSGVAGLAPLLSETAHSDIDRTKFIIEGIGKSDNFSIKELTKRVFDEVGTISRFISKGDVVIIKPNISWARPPIMAATTNPELLKCVIELCYEAGAKKVRIADNTIHDARRCFALSGAGAIAKESGADLIVPRSSMMKKMKIQGHRLDEWPVFEPVVEADKLINLPVAKHHSLSRLTLGMKNWIGAVGGRRSSLHQDIHQISVDLARFFKPTLTLIDATRILIRNGPSGGSLSDVDIKNRLFLSNDPVAADAKASLLFGIDPIDIGYIRLAKEQDLGTYDFQKLEQKMVTL